MTEAAPRTHYDHVQLLIAGEPSASLTVNEQMSVGRAADNDLVLDDPIISGHHGLFGRSHAGALTYLDLTSTNGSFLKAFGATTAEELQADQPASLRMSDEVYLGGADSHLKLRVQLEPRVMAPSLDDQETLRWQRHGHRRISGLNDFFHEFIGDLELDEVLKRAARMLLDSFPDLENVQIWLHHEEPVLTANRGARGEVEWSSRPLPVSRTILAATRESAQLSVFGTPYPKDRGDSSQSLRRSNILWGFCAPLKDKAKKVIGLVQGDNRTRRFQPDAMRLEELGPFLAYAGRVITHVVTHQAALRAARSSSDPRPAKADRQTAAGIVGKHASLRRQFDLAVSYAAWNAPVLVQGETGTGKELFARAIHDAGPRSEGPFIAVNLAAIPAPLIPSHLFGWVAGAHSQAIRDQPGLIERSDGGTLFLDEIGETPLDIQVNLLRFTESGECSRLGEAKSRTVDVRIVSATNRSLTELVDRKLFRADLFFRLSTLNLTLPSLADRSSDLPLLVEHFLRGLRQELKQPSLRLSSSGYQALSRGLWPGNVRQLKNSLTRAAILAANRSEPGQALFIEPEDLSVEHAAPSGGTPILPLKEAQDAFTRDYVQRALATCDGVQKDAAQQLGLLPSNLSRLLKRLGLATK